MAIAATAQNAVSVRLKQATGQGAVKVLLNMSEASWEGPRWILDAFTSMGGAEPCQALTCFEHTKSRLCEVVDPNMFFVDRSLQGWESPPSQPFQLSISRVELVS